MNRAERREYLRKNKNDSMASYCRVCKGKTLHYSRPTEKNLCDIVCECCRTVSISNLEGVIPMVYVCLDELSEYLKEEKGWS